MKKKKQRVEEEDDFVRIPSTKGWRESSDKSEALPIKVGKQVIKTFRENRVTSENADGDASSGEEDPQDGPHSVDDEQSMLENDSQDSDEQLIDDDNDDNRLQGQRRRRRRRLRRPRRRRTATTTTDGNDKR